MSNDATAYLVYGVPLQDNSTHLPWHDHESCEPRSWWEDENPNTPVPVDIVFHGFPEEFIEKVLFIPGMKIEAYRCETPEVDLSDLIEQQKNAETDGRGAAFKEFVGLYLPSLIKDGKLPEPEWHLICKID